MSHILNALLEKAVFDPFDYVDVDEPQLVEFVFSLKFETTGEAMAAAALLGRQVQIRDGKDFQEPEKVLFNPNAEFLKKYGSLLKITDDEIQVASAYNLAKRNPQLLAREDNGLRIALCEAVKLGATIRQDSVVAFDSSNGTRTSALIKELNDAFGIVLEQFRKHGYSVIRSPYDGHSNTDLDPCPAISFSGDKIGKAANEASFVKEYRDIIDFEEKYQIYEYLSHFYFSQIKCPPALGSS